MNTTTHGSYLATTTTPTSHERIAAAIAHGGTCVAWFFAPLLVYMMERDRSSYVARQALQAYLDEVDPVVLSGAQPLSVPKG